MTDIATLGIAVDSSQVAAASASLDKLSTSARTAQSSTAGLTSASTNLASGSRVATAAMQDVEKATTSAHGSVATATREFRALFDELSSGRTRQTPGTLAIIATRVFGIGGAALATGAAIAAIPVAFAAAAEAVSSSVATLNLALKSTGDATGLSSDAMASYAKVIADTSHISVFAAREIETGLTTTGRIQGDTFKNLALIVNDYAKATGQKVPEAAKQLATALADPLAGAKALDAEFNLLTADQLSYIETVVAGGNKEAARTVIVDALRDRFTHSTDQLGGFAKAWDSLTTSIGNAVDALGRFLTNQTTLEQKQANAGRLAAVPVPSQFVPGTTQFGLERLPGVGTSLVGGLGPPIDVRGNRQLDLAGNVVPQPPLPIPFSGPTGTGGNVQEGEGAAAATRASIAALEEQKKSMDEVVKSTFPLDTQLEVLAEREKVLQGVIDAGGDSTGNYAKALAALRFQEENMLDPVEKLIKKLDETNVAYGKTGVARAQTTALQQAEQAAIQRGFPLTAQEIAQVQQLTLENTRLTAGRASEAEQLRITSALAAQIDKDRADSLAMGKQIENEQIVRNANLQQEIDDNNSLIEALKLGTKEYQTQINYIRIRNELGVKVGDLVGAERDAAEAKAKTITDQQAQIRDLQGGYSGLSAVIKGTGSILASTFDSASLSGQKFGSVLASLGQKFASLIEQAFIFKPLETAINQLAGGSSPGGSGGGIGGLFGSGSWLGSLFGSSGASAATTSAGGWASSTAIEEAIPLAFASGGDFFSGQTMLVGEQGPEIMTAGSSGSVIPNSQLGASSGATLYVDARGSTDPAAVEAAATRAVAKALPGIVKMNTAAVQQARLRRPSLFSAQGTG